MQEISFDMFAEMVAKAKVRVTVEMTPDENGRVIQRVEIEPWEPAGVLRTVTEFGGARDDARTE